MKTTLLILSLCLTPVLNASLLLDFPATPIKEVTRSDRKFSLPEVATTKDITPSAKLKLMGAGVRKKKVVITSVDVYLIESFVGLPFKALRLTFLRSVPGTKIKHSFSESLNDNSVSIVDPKVAQALEFLSVDQEEKSEMILLGKITDKGQTLWLETQGKTLKLESPKVVDQFWSIWFGRNNDDKLQELQETLLKGFNS